MDPIFALLLDRFPSEISILGDPKQGPSTMNVNEAFRTLKIESFCQDDVRDT